MAGKKRSGLANDRRAYGCGRIYKPPTTTPVCPSITIADIATYDGSFWVLNNNTTILACQTLTIDLATLLVVPTGLTLTNNGTIVNNYGLLVFYGGAITNNGTITTNNTGEEGIEPLIGNDSNLFINNGTINVLNGTFFVNVPQSGGNDVTITNNGNINIALGGILQNEGVLINYSGGNINNRGIINNQGGTITNNTGGTIINWPVVPIYNNTGGIINNNSGATFTNDGIINNADGEGTCGVGTIIGTISGTFGIDCPPLL
jgi:hypothetical protein